MPHEGARVDIQAALTVIGRRPPERVRFEDKRDLTLNLFQANLQRADFSGSLKRVVLSVAHLEGTTLRGADLEGAILNRASLKGAMLVEANLEGAHLYGVNLEHANLREAILKGASLFDSDLSKVGYLDQNGLAAALGNATVMLPKGTPRPASWPEPRA